MRPYRYDAGLNRLPPHKIVIRPTSVPDVYYYQRRNLAAAGSGVSLCVLSRPLEALTAVDIGACS